MFFAFTHWLWGMVMHCSHASIKPLIVAAFDREEVRSILAGLFPCLGHLTNKTESLALNNINNNFSAKEVMLLRTSWRQGIKCEEDFKKCFDFDLKENYNHY